MTGRRKFKGFPVTGLLLLDKPEGVSSNHALQSAKRLLCARKAGHTGSLDPIATGVLPLCYGDATKIASFFLNSDKTYEVGIRLGQSTETGDREGDVIKQQPVTASADEITQALQGFMGEIDQIPPMYSALKRNGQPLYKLARQGIEVEREPRRVTVHDLKVLKLEDDILHLEVSCSKGFYIRSLAADLGDVLRCGAHVDTLRRTRVGSFTIDQCITLGQLELITSARDREKLLIPIDQSLQDYPEVRIPENIATYFCRGQAVRFPHSVASGLVRVYSDSALFLGLAEVQDGQKIAPKKLFLQQDQLAPA